MFILPLLAVLIGIEFILIFGRVTKAYEEKLRSDYAIIVSSKKVLTTPYLRSIDSDIESVEAMNKQKIASEVVSNIGKENVDTILKELPHFYRIHLAKYVTVKKLKEIEKELKAIPGMVTVDTFGESYETKRSLFSVVTTLLNIFMTILFLVSILLIIKQMEVWQLAHKERMQIMEIFGAPLMLRSGVLFKMAFVDAIIAALLNLGIFLYVQSKLNNSLLFKYIHADASIFFHVKDFFIWLGVSFIIVIISVLFVAFRASEAIEE